MKKVLRQHNRQQQMLRWAAKGFFAPGKNAALWLLCFCTIFLQASVCNQAAVNRNPPNIILIYADDLGKGLLSHEGQKIISTPNIDRLAAEGIRFTHAYAGMLCAPSRASLITGLHDCHRDSFELTRAGIYQQLFSGKLTAAEVEDKINRRLSPRSFSPPFLAEVVRSQGYITAQFGKLGYGFATSHRQMEAQGWDHYFGYMDHIQAHGFYPAFLHANREVVALPGNTLANAGKSGEPETPANFRERHDMTGKAIYSEHILMDFLLQFMQRYAHRPFFIHFATQLPNGPVSIPQVHPELAVDSRLTPIEKEYASMVKMLDDDVGRIMAALERLGLAENTLVIFTSDNGHEIYYAQEGRVYKPYRNARTKELFDNLERKYYSDSANDLFNGNDGRAGLKRSNLQGRH